MIPRLNIQTVCTYSNYSYVQSFSDFNYDLLTSFPCPCMHSVLVVKGIRMYYQGEEPGSASTCGHDVTPTDDHEWVKGAGRRLPMSPVQAEREVGRHVPQHQHFAELDFDSPAQHQH